MHCGDIGNHAKPVSELARRYQLAYPVGCPNAPVTAVLLSGKPAIGKLHVWNVGIDIGHVLISAWMKPMQAHPKRLAEAPVPSNLKL